MVRGVFVTGTDTGVGKTVVSAALVQHCRGQLPVRYWKPIQTGIEQDDDSAEVRRLSKCRPEEIREAGIRLERPVSPQLAARLAGASIDIEALAEDLSAEPPEARWIVEGAGGVLVPVSETDLMVDLMILLALPVVIVARSTLGTINHTLLTIEALRARGLRPAGVVLVGPPNPENREAVERHGRVAVVGDMPPFTPLTPAALAAWSASALDPDGRIVDLMR
jgi:malonyl-CoA O-methyltransferase